MFSTQLDSIDLSNGVTEPDLEAVRDVINKNHVNNISSVDQAEDIPEYIRKLKTKGKLIDSVKKDIETPLKATKDAAKIEFDTATINLKTAIEPFNNTKKLISSESEHLRKLLAEYVENKNKIDESIIKQATDALEAHKDLLNKAKHGIDDGSLSDTEVEEILEEATSNLDQFYDVQNHKIGKVVINNTSFSSYIDINIDDSSLVPVSLCEPQVDIDLLVSDICSQFPGITITGLDTDLAVIDPIYIKTIPSKRLIIDFLKKDDTNVVPGVTKLIKQRPIIR